MGEGRIPRRRRVLRAERLSHHLVAPHRARGDGPDRAHGVLEPAGTAVASRPCSSSSPRVALYAVVWAQPSELGRSAPTAREPAVRLELEIHPRRRLVLPGVPSPSPLTHTWSLAIEEQWYLVWPLAVVLMLRVFRGNRKKLTAAIVGLALASATLMAVLFHPGSDPSRVYYGTDTRSQALLVGAALAALDRRAAADAPLDHLRRPWVLQASGIAGAAVSRLMVVRVPTPPARSCTAAASSSPRFAARAFVRRVEVDGPLASCCRYARSARSAWSRTGCISGIGRSTSCSIRTRTGLAGFEFFALRVGVTGGDRHRVVSPRRAPDPAEWARAVVSWVLCRGSGRRSSWPPPGWSRYCWWSPRTARCPPRACRRSRTRSSPRRRPTRARPAILMLGDSQMFTMLFYDDAAFDEVRSAVSRTHRSSVAESSIRPNTSVGIATSGRARGRRRCSSSIRTSRCCRSARGRRSTSR